MSNLFSIISLCLLAYPFAQCVQALNAFIEPGEHWIFSSYGRWLHEKADKLSDAGKSTFWLKPIGLCNVCFGIWCAIAFSAFASWYFDFNFLLCLVVFAGAVWKWSFD